MLWYSVMAVTLVLVLWSERQQLRELGLPRALWSPKVRTWWAMMGSSLATHIHQSPSFYIAICFVGAAVVLSYRMTQWQMFIGWIFIAMAGLNFGYMLGLQNTLSTASAINALWAKQVLLGWAMLTAFIVWGGYDYYRSNRVRTGVHDSDHADSVEPAP